MAVFPFPFKLNGLRHCSRFAHLRYRLRPPTRFGRLRRTDPKYNTGHKKQFQRFDFQKSGIEPKNYSENFEQNYQISVKKIFFGRKIFF